MEAPAYQHKIVLLSTGFQYAERRLLFARARLFLDYVELRGWHYGKRHCRRLPLAHFTQIEWLSLTVREPNVVFHLLDEAPLPLILHKAHLWRHTLDERLRWISAHRKIPTDRTQLHHLPLQEVISYTASMA